jgi:UV DNA damage endonuclease
MTSLRRSTRLATTVVATSPSSTLTEEVETEETLVESPAEDEVPKKTNKKRKRKTKDDDDFVAKKAPIDDAESSPTKGKNRGARKPKEPIVYDIPDVEHRQTTFTGRLGK